MAAKRATASVRAIRMNVDIPIIWRKPQELAEVESSIVIPHPAGMPSLAGLEGTDADGRRLLAIATEWPEPLRHSVTQTQSEEDHLRRFFNDYERGVGEIPFDEYRQGANPPDFVVSVDGVELGLDLTQFVVQTRVQAYARLNRLRQAWMAEGPTRFRHLRGHIVCVTTFDSELRLRDHTDEVLRAAERLKPLAPTPGSPTNFHEFANGRGLVIAAPLQQPLPGPFYAKMKFELMHVAPGGVVFAHEAWEVLQHLVSGHDNPANTMLLVTVGGPTKFGLTFPSDRAIAGLALKHAETDRRALTARNVQRIYVHQWPMRSLYELTPGTSGYKLLSWDEDLWSELMKVSGVFWLLEERNKGGEGEST
jgi:hypothetical protein